LGMQPIQQRLIAYTAEQPPIPLVPPVQFGTHVQLTGYAVAQNDEAITIRLYWHVLQPLLPPHHIFIHLNDETGRTIAQSDAAPRTAAGRAPTGSWLPDEYLVTEHQILTPVPVSSAPGVFSLNIGLYVPSTGQRLPTVVDGVTTGDHVTVPLQP